MRQADSMMRPAVAARVAGSTEDLKPLGLVPAEIAALCNTWPNRLDTPIIPGKVFKQEKRVILAVNPDWELDADAFKSASAQPVGKARFFHAKGGRESIDLPYRVGDRLYVDERIEVIDRPDGAEWIRIKYLADETVRQVIFEEGEVRPKLGLLKVKHLPARLARGDRMVVVQSRVDRLWNADEDAARLEGAPLINHRHGNYSPNATYRFGFEAIWNEFHPPFNSFHKANWWVQVLTLRRDFDE